MVKSSLVTIEDGSGDPSWTCNPRPSSETKALDIWTNKGMVYFWQENNHNTDIICIDFGQAYNVIRVLCEALETN